MSNFREQKSKSLSPTQLAIYHHNHCELYLWNAYQSNKRQLGSSKEPDALTKAQFERGNDWEKLLVTWLDNEGLLLTVGGPTLSGQDVLSILDFEDRTHFFVHGLKFQSPNFGEDFKRYGNGSKSVKFGTAKPDFIEFTRDKGRLIWRVVDAKASKKAKVDLLLILDEEQQLKIL